MRFVLSFCMALLAGAASADTLACQYTRSAGLQFKGGQWEVTHFRLPQPFFLKRDQGRLDLKSISDFMGVSVVCTTMDAGEAQNCGSVSGQSLYFNERTMRGAISYMMGASQPVNVPDPDSVAVIMFICQVM